MAHGSEDVERFMRELEHPLKVEIEHVRSAILASSAEVSERIKWNAPSFCFRGEDRVTFRLQPKDRFQLVFHRGAKVKDTTGFSFEDDSGLLEWAAKDRGVLTFRDAKDVKDRSAAAVKLVARWMEATR
jgi:Domain of unknown function (DU1801)